MDIILLGLAGLFITLKNGKTVAIDPYLSNALFESKGERFKRLIPMKESWRQTIPDIIAITHEHADHMDLPLLKEWLGCEERLQILAPPPVFQILSQLYPTRHNIMVMRPDVEATIHGARFRAIPALHEMSEAVGYFIKAEGKCVYVTGDTLYSPQIINSLQGCHIDIVFPCINGFGNNMNAVDAARLTNELSPQMAIPVHWDMFAAFGADPALFADEISPNIPIKIMQAYETISLQ